MSRITARETTSQYGAEAWFTGVAVQPLSNFVASAPLRVKLGGRQPNGAMQIIVQGQAGRMYQVEASANLVNWAPLKTPSQADASGNAVVNDDAAGAYRYRFYRAAGR